MTPNVTLEFCHVSLHDNYMIVVMNEGIVVKPNHNAILEDIARKHFNDAPFVYITHRINSYAVDPTTYFDTSKIGNLVGFAVVSEKEIHIRNAEVEKQFLAKPFKVFKLLEEATEWAKTLTTDVTSRESIYSNKD